jgi:periplasmic divalent cation tolerance protein
MFQTVARHPVISAVVIGLSSVSLGTYCALPRLVPSAMASSSDAVPASSTAGNFSFSFVTAPNEDVAKKIARGLVSGKLAACVNIVPRVTSVYEWKGKLEEDSEVMMIIKSRSSRLEELTKYVRENHPYDVVEVISSSITHGNPPYLDWLGAAVPEKS